MDNFYSLSCESGCLVENFQLICCLQGVNFSGGGDYLTLGMGVLMCLFGSAVRKFRGLKCATCGLKFGEGKIIWGLVFLVCHCPSHFLSIKVFSKLDSRLFAVFESWSDYLGV